MEKIKSKVGGIKKGQAALVFRGNMDYNLQLKMLRNKKDDSKMSPET